MIDEDAKVHVPVLGRISAGPFALVEHRDATEWVAGDRGDRESFALIVEGSSMEKEYYNGDRIFCKPYTVVFSEEQNAHVHLDKVRWLDGKDCVVLLNGESTFKRIVINKKKGLDYDVVLTPVNPEFDKRTVHHGDEFIVQGVCYRLARNK